MALANLNNQFVIISGGCSVNNNQSFSSNLVDQYSLEQDSWQRLPDLNIGRINHASCALAKTVYVFCGSNKMMGYLNSIESLTISAENKWQLIEVSRRDLAPRIMPGTISISGHQIAILGGKYNMNCLDDFSIFDTQKLSVIKKNSGKNILINKFKSHSN